MAEQKEKWFLRVRNKITGALKKLKPKPIMDRNDAIALLGVISVVRGIALYSHPLAYIAAGVILLAFSYLSATPQKADEEEIKTVRL
jgi:hypothetical protein